MALAIMFYIISVLEYKKPSVNVGREDEIALLYVYCQENKCMCALVHISIYIYICGAAILKKTFNYFFRIRTPTRHFD